MKVSAYNPGFGIGTSPIAELCRTGSLPQNPVQGVEADWSNVTFVSVSQLGALAAVQLQGRVAGVEPRVHQPCSNIMGYMQRADYFTSLGIDVPEDFTRHDTSTRLLPISPIPIDELEAEPGRISSQMKTMLLGHIKLSESVADNLDLSLGEIIDNVVQHSRAEAPGIACAQYYKSHGFVEICVADCGIGIPASMRDNPDYADKSDNELLELAFRRKTGEWYGRSQTGTGKVSGGMGLSFAASLARATGGHIWAISHNSALHLSNGGPEHLKNHFYPGTLIVMRIPETLDEVSEVDMYGEGSSMPSRWSSVEGAYIDDGMLW